MLPPPIKQHALELGVNAPIFRPGKLNDKESLCRIRSVDAQLLVVCAYGKIFSREFLGIFPKGGINVHPSLLPEFRGPSPIPAALAAGLERTGVTIQRIVHKVDSGPILAAGEHLLSGNETAGDLEEVFSQKGADLLVHVLDEIQKGAEKETPQNETQATYCSLLSKKDGLINWSLPADQIMRLFRAYTPWPGLFTFFEGKRLELLDMVLFDGEPDSAWEKCAQGTVFSPVKKSGFPVKTGKGIITVRKLRLASRKPLDWNAFNNGVRDFVGAILGE